MIMKMITRILKQTILRDAFLYISTVSLQEKIRVLDELSLC